MGRKLRAMEGWMRAQRGVSQRRVWGRQSGRQKALKGGDFFRRSSAGPPNCSPSGPRRTSLITSFPCLINMNSLLSVYRARTWAEVTYRSVTVIILFLTRPGEGTRDSTQCAGLISRPRSLLRGSFPHHKILNESRTTRDLR